MFQILLKYNSQIELTENEKKDLDNWVLAYNHRDELFKQLIKINELQNEIAKIKQVDDFDRFLAGIKQIVPDEYIKISKEKDISIIRSNLLVNVKDYGNEIVLKLIRDHMYWGILSFLLIFVVIFILIFLIIRIS
ncbi:hypothetical protein A3860_17785 [Niastella vici]|uniref:Uncharacterized protein n=1 Tax=Niastella vici TaxID=1703345 RepID=A0A1V9G4W9_9BACT|nr:hypothetical protein [Niastella vici]OQP65516.1 hypothetical protein A3860_17785 [Niastella vici]